MSRTTVLLVLFTAIALAFFLALWRFRVRENQLNVEPHAAHEIDKAKQR